MSVLILKKHDYSQSISNALIQLYSWVYISLDIAIDVSLASLRAREGHMDKPLAMERDDRSGAEATIGHFLTKKLHHSISILSPAFHIPATFSSTHQWTFLINFNKYKSSFNIGTTLELGHNVVTKTCYDIQQIKHSFKYIFLLE